jgi:2-oxoglutarate ferredoxin oxidoreductase subunit gamma
MLEQIVIAGSGGQGVLTLGMFIARCAAAEEKCVAWLPAYGAEKRGGPSFCSLIISDSEIFSPVVETADTLIAFDQRALESYIGRAGDSTLVIENESLILNDIAKNSKKLLIPASAIAKGLDAMKVMNIVLAGSFVASRPVFSRVTAETVMKDMLGSKAGKMLEKNMAAFSQGYDLAAEKLKAVK